MTDRELLELIAKKVNGLDQKVDGLDQKVDGLEQDIKTLKDDMGQVKGALVRIENDHGDKLKALFDARESEIDVNGRIFASLARIENNTERIAFKVIAHDLELRKAK